MESDSLYLYRIRVWSIITCAFEYFCGEIAERSAWCYAMLARVLVASATLLLVGEFKQKCVNIFKCLKKANSFKLNFQFLSSLWLHRDYNLHQHWRLFFIIFLCLFLCLSSGKTLIQTTTGLSIAFGWRIAMSQKEIGFTCSFALFCQKFRSRKIQKNCCCNTTGIRYQDKWEWRHKKVLC